MHVLTTDLEEIIGRGELNPQRRMGVDVPEQLEQPREATVHDRPSWAPGDPCHPTWEVCVQPHPPIATWAEGPTSYLSLSLSHVIRPPSLDL